MADINSLVSNLYQEYLGRAPEPDVAQAWANVGGTEQDIRNALANSEEYKLRLSLYSPQQAQQTQGLSPDVINALRQGSVNIEEAASSLGITPKQLEQQYIQSVYNIPQNGIPARPTFSGLLAEVNKDHLKKYGTYVNLADWSQETYDKNVKEIQDELKRKQEAWDKTYGQTPEGQVIAANPPPEWGDAYAVMDRLHREAYGRPIDRPWSTETVTAQEKERLDLDYIRMLNEYNQRYGTNLQPDTNVLGAYNQPNFFTKEKEKDKWYENPLNIAALVAATYFGAPYLAQSLGIGGAAAGGTGLIPGAAGATGLTAGAAGATGLTAPAGFALAPELGASLLAAGGAAATGATSASVPSAFNTAVNTALGKAPELGGFGNVATGGFGTALPSASEVAAGLTAAGFAPGTAANLSGMTAAGVGATNLLGGATAATPLAASPSMSVTDALRVANAARQVAGTQQKVEETGRVTPEQMAQMASLGVDYSGLLSLLASRAKTSGLLGTQFQPQSINLASLLG